MEGVKHWRMEGERDRKWAGEMGGGAANKLTQSKWAWKSGGVGVGLGEPNNSAMAQGSPMEKNRLTTQPLHQFSDCGFILSRYTSAAHLQRALGEMIWGFRLRFSMRAHYCSKWLGMVSARQLHSYKWVRPLMVWKQRGIFPEEAWVTDGFCVCCFTLRRSCLKGKHDCFFSGIYLLQQQSPGSTAFQAQIGFERVFWLVCMCLHAETHVFV